jgi:hypothetical protein
MMVDWRILPYVVNGLGQALLLAIRIYYGLLLAAGVTKGGEDARRCFKGLRCGMEW